VTNYRNRQKSLISGVSIEHADFAAARRADKTAEAENYDFGHHRCARARRCGEIGAAQSGVGYCFPMAEPTETQVT
jgi:hypothetical protein